MLSSSLLLLVNYLLPGTVVAILKALDPDTREKHRFSLKGDLSRLPVAMVGDQLITHLNVDFEKTPSFTITVIVTDAGGLSFTKVCLQFLAPPLMANSQLVNNS